MYFKNLMLCLNIFFNWDSKNSGSAACCKALHWILNISNLKEKLLKYFHQSNIQYKCLASCISILQNVSAWALFFHLQLMLEYLLQYYAKYLHNLCKNSNCIILHYTRAFLCSLPNKSTTSPEYPHFHISSSSGWNGLICQASSKTSSLVSDDSFRTKTTIKNSACSRWL